VVYLLVPNVHSMLTEVTFCISCYLTVLLIEYLPIVLRNRKLHDVPSFLYSNTNCNKLIYVLAGVGTFLSFFHQGSLGVCMACCAAVRSRFAKAWRCGPHILLFILSAAAVGPSFILLTTWLVAKTIAQAAGEAYLFPGWRASRGLAGRVCAGQGVDTLIWINRTRPGAVSRLAVLQLETVRHLDPVRRNRHLRCFPRW